MFQVFVAISQKFCCREEECGYAKVIHKKEEIKRIRKNGQVSKISKTWVLRCPPKKRDE
jgi:hypothetical protein